MSTDQRLQQLSEQLGQTVNRIDQLQKKPTLTTRLGRHFRAQGSNILSVVLAGCVFSVATGRLIQKNEHAVRQAQEQTSEAEDRDSAHWGFWVCYDGPLTAVA